MASQSLFSSAILLLGCGLFVRTWAFSLQFPESSTQCSNLTVEWSAGKPPYTLLLVPVGHITPETRTLAQYDIQDGNSIAFQLDYPGESRFVAMLSDASGIGSGGTTPIMTVGDSSDSSCLNTVPVSPQFTFSLSPANPTQCVNTNISWDPTAQGTVDIIAMIPGGHSGQIASISNGSTSFLWPGDLPSQTEMVFVVGDNNGLGTGGSSDVLQVNGSSDSSCLERSPSTAGPASPTGSAGTSPTSSSPNPPSTSVGALTSRHKSKTTIIIVAVIATFLFLLAILGAALIFRTLKARRAGTYMNLDASQERGMPVQGRSRRIWSRFQRPRRVTPFMDVRNPGSSSRDGAQSPTPTEALISEKAGSTAFSELPAVPEMAQVRSTTPSLTSLTPPSRGPSTRSNGSASLRTEDLISYSSSFSTLNVDIPPAYHHLPSAVIARGQQAVREGNEYNPPQRDS